MPLFRCFVRGEHFPGHLFDQHTPIGFYPTRFVDAADLDDAELKALARLRADPNLQAAPEHRSPDAKVFVESIEEVPDDTPRTPDAGVTFFLE